MSKPNDPTYFSDSRPLYDRVFKNSAKSPEKRLWESVVLTLLFDTQKDYNAWRDSMNGTKNQLYNKMIQHKITATNRRMEMICGLIDLNHDCLIEKIRDICEGKYTVKQRSIHF